MPSGQMAYYSETYQSVRSLLLLRPQYPTPTARTSPCAARISSSWLRSSSVVGLGTGQTLENVLRLHREGASS
jgi:DNA-binding transcriptional regulator LsrR (DeoR family)